MVVLVGLLDGEQLHLVVHPRQEMIKSFHFWMNYCNRKYEFKKNQTIKNFKLLVLTFSQIPIVRIIHPKILSLGQSMMTRCAPVFQTLMVIIWLRLVLTLARATLAVHSSVTSVEQQLLLVLSHGDQEWFYIVESTNKIEPVKLGVGKLKMTLNQKRLCGWR